METRQVTAAEWNVELTPYGDARAQMLGRAGRTDATDIPLPDAIGLAAAQDVDAPIAVPPFDNASMDGYAVAADTVAQAGAHLPAAAVHIATGMALPDGTDAVVPWEQTTSDEAGVILATAPVESGQNVRDRGHDIMVGDSLITTGTELDPVHLGVVASVGLDRVRVFRAPRVAVLVSGDELAAPGTVASADAVYDVNTTVLPALLRRAGAEVISVEHAPDSREKVANALHRLAATADLVVTTGGASVGERDWVRTVVEEGGSVDVWRVAVRPGKPVAQGTFDDTAVIMLPGNPGSVLACTHAFVTPFVRALGGRAPDPVSIPLPLSNEIVNGQARTFLCPVELQDGSAVPLIGASSQGLLHARAITGFVVVEPSTTVPAGSTVRVELMR